MSPEGGTITGFGDLPVFDIAVLPWPDKKTTGFLVGVGPAFVFPTANAKSPRPGRVAGRSRIRRGLFGMVYRQFAPVAPQTTINFGMTVAFPQFRDWLVNRAAP